jgi:hypothetical protein
VRIGPWRVNEKLWSIKTYSSEYPCGILEAGCDIRWDQESEIIVWGLLYLCSNEMVQGPSAHLGLRCRFIDRALEVCEFEKWALRFWKSLNSMGHNWYEHRLSSGRGIVKLKSIRTVNVKDPRDRFIMEKTFPKNGWPICPEGHLCLQYGYFIFILTVPKTPNTSTAGHIVPD